LEAVEEQLRDLGIPYARQEVVEGGIVVDQVFFHDPDRVMIEVCNCESLPVCPILQSASPVKPIPEGCIVETRTLLEQNVRKGMGGGSGSSTPLSGRSTMELLDVDDGEMEA